MSHPPLVSVTVISFNQSDFLPAALQSLQNQTLDEIEIIVSDDASSDGAPELIRRFAHTDRRIRAIFRERNGGLAENRQTAMTATTGRYVAWLDADDLAAPDRLEKQVRLLEATPDATLAFHDLSVVSEEGAWLHTFFSGRNPPVTGNYLDLLTMENFVPSSSVCIDTQRLGSRAYFMNGTRSFSDWHFVVRATTKGRFVSDPEALGSYRLHPGAAMASAQKVRGGVRRRREAALWSMRRELPSDRNLLDYCLARFYWSQISAAMKQKDPVVAARSAFALLGRPNASIEAFRDRKGGRNLLASNRQD